MYDIVIVGYGPAAVTAAIYAARKNLDVLVLGDLPGGEVRNSGEIENWPGDQQTDGNALADKFIAHLKDHEDRVAIESDKAELITKRDDGTFLTKTEAGKEHESKTVIYTAGRHPRMLGVEGEEEFKNRGVTYCATCDAPLFPDKEVVVVGGGNTGAEAIIMLQKIAKKIYVMQNIDKLTADPVLIKAFEDDPKVEIMYNVSVTKISGDQMVTGISYTEEGSEEEKTLDVQGVFITIGAIPNTDPVKDLVSLDSFNAIIADRYAKTDVEGFFAAGDVTDIRDAQIVVAAGHGCSAALSAGDYISRQSVS